MKPRHDAFGTKKGTTSMKTMSLTRWIVPMAGVIACACPVFSAFAEEVLGPMAGAGGVMRDAERRALAPATAPAEKSIPQVAAPKKSEKASTPASGKVLGPVAAVKVNGSKEFGRASCRERVYSGV